jgi:hypothetical protein
MISYLHPSKFLSLSFSWPLIRYLHTQLSLVFFVAVCIIPLVIFYALVMPDFVQCLDVLFGFLRLNIASFRRRCLCANERLLYKYACGSDFRNLLYNHMVWWEHV